MIQNLFKYQGDTVHGFLTNEVSPLIEQNVASQGLTESEISSNCDDPKNKNIKTKMVAMSVSLSYLFDGNFKFVDNPIFRFFTFGPNANHDPVSWVPYKPGTDQVDVGAGDLATGPYETGEALLKVQTKF